MSHTTVVVPTFQRPELLSRCLASCRTQRLDPPLSFDVVVVDNCPQSSARQQVEALIQEVQADGSLRLTYCHEPTPGISAARNRGLSQCTGQYVAFLDDDEAARPDWLQQLHKARDRHQGHAVFGAVVVVLPPGSEWGAPMFEKSVGRCLDIPEGPVPEKLEAQLGTGNSLFQLSWLSGAQTFARELGLTGGEDTRVIAGLVKRGAQLVWAPQAVVDEAVEAKRATLRFLVERRFGSGQLRTTQQARSGKGLANVAGWMALGAGQSVVGGGRAMLQLALRQDPRAALCDLSAGLGKILWFPPFRLARYRRKASG